MPLESPQPAFIEVADPRYLYGGAATMWCGGSRACCQLLPQSYDTLSVISVGGKHGRAPEGSALPVYYAFLLWHLYGGEKLAKIETVRLRGAGS